MGPSTSGGAPRVWRTWARRPCRSGPDSILVSCAMEVSTGRPARVGGHGIPFRTSPATSTLRWRRRAPIAWEPSMDRSLQRSLAERLLALHDVRRPLVLVNAWDVASALVVQRSGLPAIATSSSAVASAAGYPDGERIPAAEMLAVVARIVAHVSVPVTADLEAGYADDPQGVADVARQLLETGAVGLNLEDGIDPATGVLRSVDAAVERIHAVCEVGQEHDVPLVINARTDVFLEMSGPPDDLLDEAIARLAAYRDAGADCLFPIGLRERDAVRRLAGELRHPVNVLAGPG